MLEVRAWRLVGFEQKERKDGVGALAMTPHSCTHSLIYYYPSAVTPGSSLPSMYSSSAPPPVLM